MLSIISLCFGDKYAYEYECCRYGREEDEVMGIKFFTSGILETQKVYPLPDEGYKEPLTEFQVMISL